MEHPFLPSQQLTGLNLDELQTKISDLTGKLTFAMRMGNGPLTYQLQMVIESYRNEYNRKMDELVKKQGIQTKINIEKEN